MLKAIPDAFYFFVWPNKSLEWILEETCRLYNLPKFIRFGDIVNHVLDQGSVIFFDEFQNFLSVEKSVYGELQRLLDERKHRGKPVSCFDLNDLEKMLREGRRKQRITSGKQI